MSWPDDPQAEAAAPRQLPLPLPPEQPIHLWRCLNCGQQLFTAPDETPPEICAYCQDMTTWRRLAP